VSFATVFDSSQLRALTRRSLETNTTACRDALSRPALSLSDFAALISPAAGAALEEMGHRAQRLTRQRFGKVIRFFAPLYLSNECINNCRYCGFSRDNPIDRVTLTVEEVRQEAEALRLQGFRNLLLVSGEHPRFVSNGYVADCVRAAHERFPAVSLEIGPMEAAEYEPLVASGAEGLVVYQETYDPALYDDLHTAGPKKHFAWRMATPERAYAAGFRRLGIGALFGLADWRYEAICVAAHAAYLLRHCWKSYLTISLPRLRPCAGEFQPLTQMTDREMTQLICAFRLMFPDVGLVLSTREPAKLRDGLIPLAITLISAGSHTEPGGYTGAGQGNVHKTVRGRVVPDGTTERGQNGVQRHATEQFSIADDRSPAQMAEVVRRLGLEPVWKDWDAAFTA
jgi:2-iminoacetate synthase